VIGRPTINLLGTGPSGSVTGLTATTHVHSPAQAIALAQFLEDLSVHGLRRRNHLPHRNQPRSRLPGPRHRRLPRRRYPPPLHPDRRRGITTRARRASRFPAGAIANSNIIYAFLNLYEAQS